MRVTVDGNEAAADVAFRLNELCAIYPITPSSTMAELADEWSSHDRANVWGTVPTVIEMQSEGGAAGALHGALQAGALATTFTASQGLLLMIPNMYKIAGELTSTVIHVAARSLATQGLSIFGDHQDVMAVRQTGFALLSSGSVQEAHDLALVAQAATLRSRIPFVHFFDGFRTSHELNTIETISDDVLRAVVPEHLVREHRARSLSPERPFVRGTAQNPDVYFQARETVNPFYAVTPGIVQDVMDEVAGHTGRPYRLVEYAGHPEPDRVVVVMGSGGQTVAETVRHLNDAGERVGVVRVRLYRPFPSEALLEAIPASVRSIAVLDRTKEPGSTGEPLYLDVVSALADGVASGRVATMPRVIGGRYGLSSKEFTPGMVAGVYAALDAQDTPTRFTVGINDDVSGTSLDYDPSLDIEDPETLRAVFFGLGSDGTVGANKNTIKILGAAADVFAQAYFVYDSKKSGGSPSRTCASGRTTSGRRTSSRARASSAATTSASSRSSTCWPWPSPVAPSCSTRRCRRTRSGTPCPGRCRSSWSPRGCGCSPSTPTGWPATPGSRAAPTPCCRPASSRSPAYSRPTTPSARSRRPSTRPTRGGATRWSPATRPPSTRRSAPCTRSSSPPRARRPGRCRTWSHRRRRSSSAP